MARTKLRLDSPGILEVLKSADVASLVADTADSVASNVSETVRSGEPLPVKVATYTTDRAAAGVTLAHPAGLGMEAKHGSLSKAAAAAGLEVRSKK